MKHNPENDDVIAKLIDDPKNGEWDAEVDQQVYTPNPRIFSTIEPMQLATYFAEYGDGKRFLNLP